MNVDIWADVAQFLFWEYMNPNFFAVCSAKKVLRASEQELVLLSLIVLYRTLCMTLTFYRALRRKNAGKLSELQRENDREK
jgi:hypothetical protein